MRQLRQRRRPLFFAEAPEGDISQDQAPHQINPDRPKAVHGRRRIIRQFGNPVHEQAVLAANGPLVPSISAMNFAHQCKHSLGVNRVAAPLELVFQLPEQAVQAPVCGS